MRKFWGQKGIAAPLVALALAALVACGTDVPAAGSTGALGDATGDGLLQQCIGVKPPASAWQAKAGPEGVAGLAAPVLGAMAPTFALTDFQPQSCGYGATYGLTPFRGKVTVVALLAGW